MQCNQCKATVTLTFRRNRPLGVRCADCLVIFCLDCAWWHFGSAMPRWARRRTYLRVKDWKKPPANMLSFGNACTVKR